MSYITLLKCDKIQANSQRHLCFIQELKKIVQFERPFTYFDDEYLL